MLGAGDTIEIEDPDFMFGDDGEIIQLSPRPAVVKTPATPAGAPMSGDAGTSARVRAEHEEGRRARDQVSFTALSHVFLHRNFSSQSHGLVTLPPLAVGS